MCYVSKATARSKDDILTIDDNVTVDSSKTIVLLSIRRQSLTIVFVERRLSLTMVYGERTSSWLCVTSLRITRHEKPKNDVPREARERVFLKDNVTCLVARASCVSES